MFGRQYCRCHGAYTYLCRNLCKLMNNKVNVQYRTELEKKQGADAELIASNKLVAFAPEGTKTEALAQRHHTTSTQMHNNAKDNGNTDNQGDPCKHNYMIKRNSDPFSHKGNSDGHRNDTAFSTHIALARDLILSMRESMYVPNGCRRCRAKCGKEMTGLYT